MTDLDNTQIITADDSLLQNSSTIDTEASLKIISGADCNTYPIGKETIIGRSNPSDLIISASSLSKQHAKITVNNGQYFITDLGSSNKTFQNKVQLQANVCYALHNGDEIKLGDIICLFEEHTASQTNKNTLSEPAYETYVPVVNTLVEEDSPWHLDDDNDDDNVPPPVVAETNVDVIPSTQTISDSYDDQEPTQPMKIWNGNTNNNNRLSRTSLKSSDDTAPKENGVTSSFIPRSSSSVANDEDSLVIGGTTLPATVPLVIESTQLNNDDQLEIISSTQTKKIIDEDDNAITIETTTTTTAVEIPDTQAYVLEPPGENSSTDNLIAETQPYELEAESIVTTVVETKSEELHQIVVNGSTVIEQVTTRTTTTVTENENSVVETLAYDLQPTVEETTTTTTTTLVENTNLPMETLAYDLQPTTEAVNTTTTTVEETTTTTTMVVENANLPMDTLRYDLQPTVEETTTTTTTTVIENANLPMETLAYNLQPTIEETTTTTMVIENTNLPMETLAYDLQPTVEETTATTTTTVIENANLPMETLAYDLQPTIEETTTTTMVIENTNLPTETLAYDLQPTSETINIDESTPAVCADTQAYNLDEQIDDLSPRPASETLEVVSVSKLVEQLKEAENAVDEPTPKQQVEVIIDPDVAKEVAASEPMDADQPDVPTTTIADQSPTNNLGKEEANTNTIEETAAIQSTATEPKTKLDLNKSLTTSSTESDQQKDEPATTSTSEEVLPSTLDISENQPDGEEEEEEAGETEDSAPTASHGQRGVPRRAARRARGRRGAATRARVVSTRLHGTRRNAVPTSTLATEDNNATLEETVNTETEESPKKATTPVTQQKSNQVKTTPSTQTDEPSATSQTNSGSNIRVSARIKARASTGRNRPFPYTDDYVDLDDLEKQSKTANTPPPTTTGRRSTRGARSSSAPQKRISLRQQPIDASESPDEKTTKQKANIDIYEQMDTGGENEEPIRSTKAAGQKRKSTTPVASTTSKRGRTMTPVTSALERETSVTKQPSPSTATTPKRGRKSTKVATPTEPSPEKQSSADDRPVRIALSSHLNFDQNHLEILRKLGFEIMDESCQVDALVVDRIRRTKKFFMCLARGAHILSPAWIEAMVKENRYIPYEKYYLDDSTAETRYGFQLRESVRLAKEHPIFENYKIFCTKDTSPPYDDLKDIIEAAGGKFIEKINWNKPGKDLICIVAQQHKNEYEALYKKGVPIVSEEFALSGISKQKLDFDIFSLFQNAATPAKPTGSK